MQDRREICGVKHNDAVNRAARNEEMKVIGLIDVDGHAKKKKCGATIYPNLALAKIARYWRTRGGKLSGLRP